MSSPRTPQAKHGSRSKEGRKAAHARAEAEESAEEHVASVTRTQRRKRTACERTARKRYGEKQSANRNSGGTAKSGGKARRVEPGEDGAMMLGSSVRRVALAVLASVLVAGICDRRTARLRRRPGGASHSETVPTNLPPGGEGQLHCRGEQPRRRSDRRQQGTGDHRPTSSPLG